MGHWTTLARDLTGKRPADDQLEIAVQAVTELSKECSDLKSLVLYLERRINELERRQNFAS
jgi:uncharacterized protein YqhQ